MNTSQTPRMHWSDRQQQRQEQRQQQMQQQPAPQLPLDRAAADDITYVPQASHLAATLSKHRGGTFRSWPALPAWTQGACGTYRAYIGRAMPTQVNCSFSCCIDPSQPQTISQFFITCPVAATVTDWLCRLWQAMTEYLPVVSAASLMTAIRPSEQPSELPSDALVQTQASSVAQHLGCVSDCPGQPVNTTFRCLRARRNHGVISFVTTSFTVIIILIYLTSRPFGETTRVQDCQSHDLQRLDKMQC